LQLL
jgi:hypothetical protein